MNRNQSYISDSFAQKLIDSADYKPIVGTYNYQEKDFGGHEHSTDKRAYGVVVPKSATWEDHLDADGVSRSYATFDVIVWTEYWDEAKEIFQKAQSMELDKNSIKGSWKDVIYNDFEDQAFVYTDGFIKGLCVLGSAKEPCFQGASFFDLNADADYQKFNYAMQKYFNGGKDAMEEVKNTSVEATEETEVVTEHTAAEPEAEASVPAENEVAAEAEAISEPETASDLETSEPEQVVSEPEAEPEVAAEPEAEPVTEEPAESAPSLEDQLKELRGACEALQQNLEALTQDLQTLRHENSELQGEKATLNSCYEALKKDVKEKDELISSYVARIENYEKKEKEELMSKFSKCLPAATLQQIEEEKDNLTLDALNSRLALEYTSFSMAKEQNEDIRIPQVHTADEPMSAFAQLLSRYKK